MILSDDDDDDCGGGDDDITAMHLYVSFIIPLQQYRL